MLNKERVYVGGGDLHLHTLFSDGAYTLEELFENISLLKLDTVSITDHDSVQGIQRGLDIADKYRIELIPGVELSCSYGKDDIHILGYFIDYKSPHFITSLKGLHYARRNRIYMMIEKLNSLGFKIDSEHFFEEIDRDSSVGRLHLALYMVKNKMVRTLQEVFQRYLGDGRPACCNINVLDVRDGIGLILRSGGVPVYAHPGLSKRADMIPRMVSMGLMGIEVFNPANSEEVVSYYCNMAEDLGLVITGGSDCHGFNKKEILLGKVRLSEEKIDRLRELARDKSKIRDRYLVNRKAF